MTKPNLQITPSSGSRTSALPAQSHAWSSGRSAWRSNESVKAERMLSLSTAGATHGVQDAHLAGAKREEHIAQAGPPGVEGFETRISFDSFGRLTTANDPENETAHPPHTNHDFGYVYGNRAPHQATKIGDRNVVYDANGNTLRECRDHGDANCQANSDKLRRYFWGEENELNAVIDGGGWNITRFIYDAGGQRVVKLGRGGESITVGQFFALKGRKAATKHVFIGETRIASKLLPSPGWEPSWSEGTTVSGPIVDGTATVTGDLGNGCNPSTYQPQKCPIDPAANPVLDRRPDTTKIKPATYYYHSDHLGSTSWVTDQNGRVHEHVEYFPYGEVWRDARYDSDGDPVHRQQFLFSAKEMDEETGLYYFGARYLDPVRARWVSTDPALESYLPSANGSGGGLPAFGGVFEPANVAVYVYVLQNPLSYSDPDGRAPNQAGVTNPSVISAELAGYAAAGLTHAQALAALSQAHGDNQNRYFYTDQFGWVDVRHFGAASELGVKTGSSVTVELLGLANEVAQWWQESGNDYRSGFSPEDVPSNAAGARFGESLNPAESLSAQFDAWINSVAGRDVADPLARMNGLPLTDPSVKGGANRGASNVGSVGPEAQPKWLEPIEFYGP